MNQKVLIIGGTSGLGRELAKLYCLQNDTVGIIGRRENLLNEFVKEFPTAKTLQADISSDSIEKQLDTFTKQLGGIDVLILTASIIHFNPELSINKEKDTLNTNISGFIRVINFAYHYFKERNTGKIAVVTSVAKARGNKAAPAYNASKAFQSSYMEGLRLRIKAEKLNIAVTEIVPGYIETGMAKGDRIFWMTSVNKAARQTKKAIDIKKRIAFITPRWWWVYQVQRLMPYFLYERLTNSAITLKKIN